MITSSAGYTWNRTMRGSTAVPAAMSNSGVSRITPVISRMARRASGSFVMKPRTEAYRQTAMAIHAMTVLAGWAYRTMSDARNRNGMVTMSPEAVTMGVETVSRS